MAKVALEHVSKLFDGTAAVKDLNLDIQDGEFLVLVGPSGCGKSTALRMVAGLEQISEGRVIIGDRVVNNLAPAARNVAMVFQSYALYPHMTVYRNLAFGLQNQKMPKEEIDKRVKKALQILDLDSLVDRRPKQLSGGQRQRVALGRAIVREPEVFLMDEPLSNLDAKLRVATRAEILKLHRRLGTTTIYVTHDQVEAMTMGDRIAVMRAGILQQAGTPEELYTKPDNVFVAGFIGSPAMNLISVQPGITDGRSELRQNEFVIEVPERLLSDLGTGGRNEVIAGLRPEHFDVVERESRPDEARVRAVVDVVEYLGDEQLVHLHSGDVELVAKLPVQRRLSPEQHVVLTLPLGNLHLFDPGSEEAIPVPASA
ncbi:MAG: ABC transporter ATP-binding protein [Actinomycetota bacterium]